MTAVVRKYLNKLLCAALLGLVLLSLAAPAVVAQPEQLCTLNIDYIHEEVPVSGAQFRLYRIANLDDRYEPVYTGIFSDLRLDAEELGNAVLDLYERVEAQNAQPEHTVTTDQEGQASISGIEAGAFLLVGESATVGSFTYHVDKQILILPTQSQRTGQWESTLTLRPKSTKLPSDLQLIGIKTEKRWEDQGYENDRPNAISVRLLRDGKTVSTVTLSEANNWTYTWTNLLPNARWSVEEDVPQGYVVNVEKNENTFTLTNYRKNIEQTGQIWWPVITVICVGLVLILLGVSLRRSGRHEA